jgi:hypothetical protein
MKPMIPDSEKPQKAVKIVPTPQKKLSKNQLLFNKLTAQIEKLKLDLKTENVKLDLILAKYAKTILPVEKEVAGKKVSLARALADSVNRNKFGKNQKDDIIYCITELCDDAFKTIEPDADMEAFYDAWAKTSYKESLNEENDEMKSMFSDYIKNEFGFDVDLSDMDGTPEKMAQFAKKMEEELKNREGKEEQKKKSKKQAYAEEKLKEEENTKLKSMRDIYIGLAKILHPDTETDVAEKLIKEELMKKLTAAYDAKDLTALLALEMQWVHEEGNHLEKVSEQKITIYLKVLQEQALTLQREKYMLYNHPRYHQVLEYAYQTEKQALLAIKRDLNRCTIESDYLSRTTRDIERDGTKKSVLEYVKEMKEQIEDDFLDFFYA